jgi:hypothetical protein
MNFSNIVQIVEMVFDTDKFIILIGHIPLSIIYPMIFT